MDHSKFIASIQKEESVVHKGLIIGREWNKIWLSRKHINHIGWPIDLSLLSLHFQK